MNLKQHITVKSRLFLGIGMIVFGVLFPRFASCITLKAGVDYDIVKPSSLSMHTNTKTEIVEFFSFSCIHCAHLEPLLDSWVTANKDKVILDKIQVVWQNNFVEYGKLNATIQSLQLGDQLNQKVFNAVLVQKRDLQNMDQLKQFLIQNHVNLDTFMQSYNSFTVAARAKEYETLTKDYNILATPTFIVDGKYMTKPATPERLLQVLQALVNQAKR